MQINDSLSPLVHRESGVVRGYDVGRDTLMTIPRMIEALHEASISQVLKLKLSALELAKSNLTWVLVQQHLIVARQPMLGEKLNICTHPSGKDRLYTYRDFYLEDQHCKDLARASSTWILMDTKNRRIGKYPDFITKVLEPSNELPHLPRAAKLKFAKERPDAIQERTVAIHDLDFNGHLSNPFYFKWILDLVPSEIWVEQRLVEFNIRFKEEAHLRDQVQVRIRRTSDHIFEHEMAKGDMTIAFARSQWGNR